MQCTCKTHAELERQLKGMEYYLHRANYLLSIATEYNASDTVIQMHESTKALAERNINNLKLEMRLAIIEENEE